MVIFQAGIRSRHGNHGAAACSGCSKSCHHLKAVQLLQLQQGENATQVCGQRLLQVFYADFSCISSAISCCVLRGHLTSHLINPALPRQHRYTQSCTEAQGTWHTNLLQQCPVLLGSEGHGELVPLAEVASQEALLFDWLCVLVLQPISVQRPLQAAARYETAALTALPGHLSGSRARWPCSSPWLPLCSFKDMQSLV